MRRRPSIWWWWWWAASKTPRGAPRAPKKKTVSQAAKSRRQQGAEKETNGIARNEAAFLVRTVATQLDPFFFSAAASGVWRVFPLPLRPLVAVAAPVHRRKLSLAMGAHLVEDISCTNPWLVNFGGGGGLRAIGKSERGKTDSKGGLCFLSRSGNARKAPPPRPSSTLIINSNNQHNYSALSTHRSSECRTRTTFSHRIETKSRAAQALPDPQPFPRPSSRAAAPPLSAKPHCCRPH